MKKTILLLFFSVFISTIVLGQRLHMPEEIISIMEESKVNYQFDSLETINKIYQYPNAGQLAQQLSRIENQSEIRLESRVKNHSKKVSKKLKKGDKLLSKNKVEKARLCYMQAYEERMFDTYIINKIANSYLKEKNYSTAAFWYERSIEFNFIDTEARRKNAVCYSKLGDKENAINNISYAHLFNRNNKEILSELDGIYKQFGYQYHDESFEPQYKIIPVNSSRVKILFGHSVWAAYAAVDAVWKHEPDYEKSMRRISNQKKSTIKDKEALLNSLITYENLPYSGKEELFPLLELLSDISLKKQIEQFMIYEIISKNDPIFILDMKKEEIEKLKDYLLLYRSNM